MYQFKPRESRNFVKKPISRKFCFFEIKSNWSILNQIMISLFLLTFITLLFVTSQVIIGLYVSKHFFTLFAETAIQNYTKTLYTAEAKWLQITVQNQSSFDSALVQTYPIVDNQSIMETIYFASQLQNSNDTFSKCVNSTCYLAGNYQNSSNSFVVLYMDNINEYNQADEILSSSDIEFNENLLYTIYLISGSFLLILLLGWIFAYYIVRPLKKLAEYAQHINQNTTRLSTGKRSKQKPIELQDITAQDKIGELVDEFKNLIQGLAGLKKGNIQKKSQEIKPFLEGYENQNQDQFQELLTEINKIEEEKQVGQFNYDFI
ncbi:unnamed protein product [Paramecium octaurelia]|uniref:HAMP domain-containing protein n=1 Tax=Paramecium octaurelia TaxID=43137 RepID=A0A8S1X2I1_PAROT|nr:unnamed protein product [Paramecium octaurelia]